MMFPKTCSCGKRWETLHEFLDDSLTSYIGEGMGAHGFNHNAPRCGTTLILSNESNPLRISISKKAPDGQTLSIQKNIMVLSK